MKFTTYYDLVPKISFLAILNLCFFYNLILNTKLLLNFSQKIYVRSTVQHLKELLKINFEILRKTKKNGQLANFA